MNVTQDQWETCDFSTKAAGDHKGDCRESEMAVNIDV